MNFVIGAAARRSRSSSVSYVITMPSGLPPQKLISSGSRSKLSASLRTPSIVSAIISGVPIVMTPSASLAPISMIFGPAPTTKIGGVVPSVARVPRCALVTCRAFPSKSKGSSRVHRSRITRIVSSRRV